MGNHEFEVEVWVRDLETNEVDQNFRKLHGLFKLTKGKRLEVWVDDVLRYEEEGEDQEVTDISVIESEFKHERVLRLTFITIGNLGWQISSVRLVKSIEEAKDPMELMAALRDNVYEVEELYEIMVFKVIDGVRDSPVDYGHYRTNDPDELLRVHQLIVDAIKSEELKPIVSPREDARSKISPWIASLVERSGDD